jgi:hypothetical protein
MEQSSAWEAIKCSASQQILNLEWNPKVHCHVHKSPPPHPIQSQESSPHTNSFFKIHFNIILPFMLRSPKWSLPFRFANYNFESITCLLLTDINIATFAAHHHFTSSWALTQYHIFQPRLYVSCFPKVLLRATFNCFLSLKHKNRKSIMK